MKRLPHNLAITKNLRDCKDPWITLLEITLVDLTVYRFCNDNADITFESNVYTSFPFEFQPIKSSNDGHVPSVDLKVCNVTRFLQKELNDQDGAVGATVKATIINVGYLTEDYSLLEMEFTVMLCTVDEEWINWTLGMINPKNMAFPVDRILKNHCQYPYVTDGTGECKYSGALTTCLRTYDDCINHANQTNFGGWVGVEEGGIRIA